MEVDSCFSDAHSKSIQACSDCLSTDSFMALVSRRRSAYIDPRTTGRLSPILNVLLSGALGVSPWSHCGDKLVN